MKEKKDSERMELVFMSDIIVRASCFVAIIVLGYVLRRIGVFRKEDFSVLSKIVIRITLPASIVYSFSGKQVDLSMLFIVLLGLGAGLIYMLLGYCLYARSGKEKKAFGLLNMSGFNIGNFTTPFVQSFLGPTGVIVTSLFDTGNAVICLGGAYGVAAMVKEGNGFSGKRLGKALLTSVPFLTYILMTSLNLMHLTLPAPVVSFAQIIANANAFLPMFMIGVGFQLAGDRSQIGTIVKMLLVRFGTAAVFALAFYYLLPFSLEIRQTLCILVFSPIASAAPPFTGEIKGDVGLASALNSMSIIISIMIMVTLMTVML